MAYLDNTTVTVDAVLTKKGRERLSQGRGAFKITKFAVADDEIDYSLYNTAHPLGSNYYSNIIESMPILEAIPDESQTMRYKLVTMTGGVTRIPKIINVPTSITLEVGRDQNYPVSPVTNAILSDGTTITYDGASVGYTIILYNEDAAIISVPAGAAVSSTVQAPPSDVGTDFSSTFVTSGTSFTITPKSTVSSTINTKITIFGNESGATVTIPLTVNPTTSV